MRKLIKNIVAGAIALGITATTLAGVEVRLKDGSRWRGAIADSVRVTVIDHGIETSYDGQVLEVGDWHVSIETELAGELRRKTIFKNDIVSMKTLTASETETKVDLSPRPGAAKRAASQAAADPKKPGVFVLPLKGTVGVLMRHDEIKAMAEHADEFGSGQTIVMLINSPGGSVVETEKIHATLMDVKKRHRLVAWIKEAISAACATALHADEIYFMSEGNAGAMTAYSGQTALSGEMLEKWLQLGGDWAEAGGRYRGIAEAMIHAPRLLSYDKDPETGEVTWHNDLSGEFILSRDGENLVLTASQALHSGFADGIADTEEELAKLLHLPEWYEKSDFGRKLAKNWEETVERASEEIPILRARLQIGVGGGDMIAQLSKRIQILQELIKWHKRCEPVAAGQGIRPADLEREIKYLRKQIADIKKARRG